MFSESNDLLTMLCYSCTHKNCTLCDHCTEIQ